MYFNGEGIQLIYEKDAHTDGDVLVWFRGSDVIAAGDVFDKIKYEEFLIGLQDHSKEIFGDLPVHYDGVGHWLRQDAAKATVDVLLDFK